jgi:hypothetical protein
MARRARLEFAIAKSCQTLEFFAAHSVLVSTELITQIENTVWSSVYAGLYDGAQMSFARSADDSFQNAVPAAVASLNSRAAPRPNNRARDGFVELKRA